MTGQIVLQSSPESNNRRKPLLSPKLYPFATSSPLRDKKPNNVGECAGSTAAECAAICCCCPLVVMEFLVIAVYKLPISIFRRIWRKRLLRNKLKKRRMSKNHCVGVGDSDRRSTIHCLDDELSEVDHKDLETFVVSVDGSEEVVDDLDKEMWEWFHNTGFGRSVSQRHS